MIITVGSAVNFDVFFHDSTTLAGKAGIAVTVDVFNPAGVQVVSNATATEIGGGLYSYPYTLASAGNWRAIFSTADTGVVANELAALWIAHSPDESKLDAIVAATDTLESGQTDILNALSLLSGGSSGSLIIGITVTDGVSPIPNALVSIRSGGVTVTYGKSDAVGEVDFYLDAGSYAIIVTAPGYQSALSDEVFSTDTDVQIDLTQISISPPAEPGVCRMYVYVRMPDGTIPDVAVATEKAVAKVTVEPGVANVDFFNKAVAGVYDEVNGFLYWDVPVGATVEFSAKGFFAVRSLAVPDLSTYDMTSDTRGI